MDPIDDSKKLDYEFQAWKTAVEVQQHFNTIEMQIRNIAVTVLTAAIAAAGLSSMSSRPVTLVFLIPISSSSFILFASLIAWGAFYLMDRWWYHRLLRGAVDHAEEIEDRLKDQIPGISLGSSISKASAFYIGQTKIRSARKIDLFYLLVGLCILFCALALAPLPPAAP